MRRQAIQGEVAANPAIIEVRQKRPLWQRLGALGAATLLTLSAYAKVADITDKVPNIPPFTQTEKEVIPGLSSVIALELAKTREFRGTLKTYAVTAEMEKREKKEYAFGLIEKTKKDKKFIVTKGTARGVVDFTEVNEANIAVSEDNKIVTIRLPHAKPSDVAVSHKPEDARVSNDGANTWCRLSLDCERVTYMDLLELADKNHTEAVGKDRELLTEAELEAEGFLEDLINGVSLPLLRNQNPNFEPSRIDVRLEYYDPAAQQAPVESMR